MVAWLVGGGIFVAAVWWRFGTESGRAFHAQAAEARADRAPRVLSEVGSRAGGVLVCPKCDGGSFKAHRRLGTKLAFGAASMLGTATRVRCVTCGTDYQRG